MREVPVEYRLDKVHRKLGVPISEPKEKDLVDLMNESAMDPFNFVESEDGDDA